MIPWESIFKQVLRGKYIVCYYEPFNIWLVMTGVRVECEVYQELRLRPRNFGIIKPRIIPPNKTKAPAINHSR